MIKHILPLLGLLVGLSLHVNGQTTEAGLKHIYDIRLSDPCILPDSATQTYYMTGTGGKLWKSKDLKMWSGPYDVVDTHDVAWMGSKPEIWAAELHRYNGKYYYFATFTNKSTIIGHVNGRRIERRACHVLVSDTPDGPYKAFGDSVYLPAEMSTLDGTLWIDTDGKPYMIYCHEWIQNANGTIEKIPLKADLSGTKDKAQILFRASDSPWSKQYDSHFNVVPNQVTDGPYLFRTATGRLGMIWTSWIFDKYTQGVAYSESGMLNGPWIQQEKPITPPDFGHGMIFKTFDGKWLMSVHSHRSENGVYIRVPHLFQIDLSGDELKVGKEYRP